MISQHTMHFRSKCTGVSCDLAEQKLGFEGRVMTRSDGTVCDLAEQSWALNLRQSNECSAGTVSSDASSGITLAFITGRRLMIT